MAANALCVSSEFDIFADRHVQTSTFNILEIAYKPITSVDQSDLEFVMPPDNETYIDLNCNYTLRVNWSGQMEPHWIRKITLRA
jgi:hypothetical protein